MSQMTVSRRRLLQGAAALVPMLAAPAFIRRAYAQSFDWQKYKGDTIDVLLIKKPANDVLMSHLDEFTELTGITASAEQVPEQQHRQRLVIEFGSGAPTFDVSELTLTVQKRVAGKGEWFET